MIIRVFLVYFQQILYFVTPLSTILILDGLNKYIACLIPRIKAQSKNLILIN